MRACRRRSRPDRRSSLFEGRHWSDPVGAPGYEVTPDGQRFMMVQLPEEGPDEREIVYIPDSFDELKGKMREAEQ